MPNVLNSRNIRICLYAACLALFLMVPRVSGQLAVVNGVKPTPDWYTNSCAAKLFLYDVWGYDRILNTTASVVQERVKRYQKKNSYPPPLVAIVTEYERARPFLEFLKKPYPQSFEAFLAPDDDENIAQHIWATLLLNYQDGGRRVVHPCDIRTLLFINDVVQPVLVGSPEYSLKSQFVDATMVGTGARLFLDSVDQWEGQLDQLSHPNPYFNRRAHERFWWSYCAYIGILRHYDSDAALKYVEDMVMLRRDHLHRWLWNPDYFAGIREAYDPGGTNIYWTHPREALLALITIAFADKIPYLLNFTGEVLLTVTDQIITSPIIFKTHVQVLSPAEVLEGAANLAPKVRGVKEYAGRVSVGDVAHAHYTLHDASPVGSAEALREALMKWQYYFTLHTRMLRQQESEGCPWIGVLLETRLPIMTAIYSIFTSREAQANHVESSSKRMRLMLQEAKGCIQYGHLVPAFRNEMYKTTDEIIHGIISDEELEPELQDIAARIAMKWEEAKQSDCPGDLMEWDDWSREIGLAVW